MCPYTNGFFFLAEKIITLYKRFFLAAIKLLIYTTIATIPVAIITNTRRIAKPSPLEIAPDKGLKREMIISNVSTTITCAIILLPLLNPRPNIKSTIPEITGISAVNDVLPVA